MDIQKIISIILLAISTLAILAALIFDMASWAVYVIAIFGIPTMAKPRKDDKEERIKEPFTGY